MRSAALVVAALLGLGSIALAASACGAGDAATTAATTTSSTTSTSTTTGTGDAGSTSTDDPSDSGAVNFPPDDDAGSADPGDAGATPTPDAGADDPGGGDDGDPPADAGATPGKAFQGAYASPQIVAANGKLHAYLARQKIGGTIIHTPHLVSDGTGQGWTYVGEALPKLGKGAEPNGSVWAPGAAKVDANRWVIFYTATVAGTQDKKCIWRAVSKDADGPFVDAHAGPIVCSGDSHWAIDAYLMHGPAGGLRMIARIDQGAGINTIQERLLDANGDAFASGSSWLKLTEIDPGSWEEPVMENAALALLPLAGGTTKHWMTFYSGGSYKDETYAVGYADCGDTLHAGCTKKTPKGPWLASDPALEMWGPGTPTFYEEGGVDYMAVSGWRYKGGYSNPKNGNKQSLYTFRVTVNAAGVPTAHHVHTDF